MRRYRVRRAAALLHDIDLIEAHLVAVYEDLGEDPHTATLRAAARIEAAMTYLRSFATHPYRGTERPDVRPGLRHVPDRRFIFYFEIDEPAAEVRILAAFFGGADRRRQIQQRLRR